MTPSTDPPLANAALVQALTGIYPGLSAAQILTLASKVDWLAQAATRQMPWLAATLRAARTDAELRQADVASAMDWSVSKVVRIENGAIGVGHNDLQALIRLYRIRNPETVDRLVTEARERRHAGRRPERGAQTTMKEDPACERASDPAAPPAVYPTT